MTDPFAMELSRRNVGTGAGGGGGGAAAAADPFSAELSRRSAGAQPDGNFISRAMRGVSDLFTGSDRREQDLPEVNFDVLRAALPGDDLARTKGAAQLVGKLGLATDDSGQVDILRQALPGLQSRNDRFGNAVVSLGGKDYFVNAPGLSGRDVDSAMTGGLIAGALASPLGRLGGAALGIGGSLAGVGLGTGAASVVQDVAAQGAGSTSPVSWEKAGGAALAGAGGEAAGRLVATGVRALRGPGRFVDEAGNLTEDGAAAMRRAGVADPATISQDTARRFADEAATAARPADAAAYAEAQTLPVPVPVTRGNVSLRPGDQMFESQAAKDVHGESAGRAVRDVRDQQQEALRQNLEAIRGRLSGGNAQVSEQGAGAAGVQQRLVAIQEAERQARNDAFAAARTHSAQVPGDSMGGLSVRVTQSLADHNLAGLPRTNALLGELNAFADTGQETSIAQLFDWRKRITSAQRGIGHTEDGVALGKMKSALDDFLGTAARDNLIRGDADAIRAFQAANEAHRQYAGRFQGGDLIQLLTERNFRSGARVLSVAPEDAAKAIFTASDTAWLAKKDLARDLVRMRDVLGSGSQEWNALREEAFLRLSNAGMGPTSPAGIPQVSGVKYNKALQDALRKSPEVMRTLFSPEELSTMQQLGRVALRTTKAVEGGANFSNTSAAQADAVKRILGMAFLGNRGGALAMSMLGPIVRGAQGSRARLAIGLPLERAPALPPGLAGTAAATAQQLEQQREAVMPQGFMGR